MRDPLEGLVWTTAELGEALEAVASAAGLPVRTAVIPAPPGDLLKPGGLELGRWIEGAANWIGLEAEPVESSYANIERMLLGAGPAILRLYGGSKKGSSDGRFVALLCARGRRVVVLGRDHNPHTLALESLRAAVCDVIESPFLPVLNRLLDKAGVAHGRRQAAHRAILRERFGGRQIRGCWLLRRHPRDSFARQALQMGLWRHLIVFLGAHAMEYSLFILSWWMVGRGALGGHVDPSWLLAWGLVLISLTPFRAISMAAGSNLAIEGGALLKQRLLAGSLGLEADHIRHQGAGQLLGKVLESEAVESLAFGGGMAAFISCVDLLVAVAILFSGTTGLQGPVLVAWLGLTAVVALWYYRCRRRWTEVRFRMTNDLVERMIGHRTRLAQEQRAHWHDDEDRELEQYLKSSATLDRVQVLLTAFVPRGWLLAGTLCLVPVFVSGATSTVEIAIAVGVILLAFRALRTLVVGLMDVAGAVIAWTEVAPLQHAAMATEFVTPVSLPAAGDDVHTSSLIEAHQIVFHYPNRERPILDACSLRIARGDRILIEGRSGGGKSTLCALLCGLQVPDQGLLLLDGLDRKTVGLEGWRRRVAAAPQFQENYVLSATFAFNLLMGRRWPPRPGDLAEAEAVCRALDLGDLLNRMPAGLMQMVGETGWQLSHGEKSRLYIARTLLQGADLVVLDESFSALDPETLCAAMACVLDRASTVIVVAHP